MSETAKSERLQEHLEQVLELLEKQHVIEDLVHRQDLDHARHDLLENLVHRQQQQLLKAKLDELHPADIAYILEMLPLDQRLLLWELVRADFDGDILLEVSDAVRESLIAHMDSHELLKATEQLDTDEIADLAQDLPPDVLDELLVLLDDDERAEVQSALSYPEDQVGALMDFEMVRIRADVKTEVVLRYLRRFDELPSHTDKLFVIDDQSRLQGVLALNKLLVSDPDALVADVMAQDMVSFEPQEDASAAAQAFERYDLVSAPVINSQGILIGRLTVDAVVDYIREETDSEALNRAGLREEEDLFAPVWKSAHNRWLWLGVNLLTAFAASRVIGLFEQTIAQLVQLAALMPIVAGIGGNSGNQTSTLIIRGLALGHIHNNNQRRLVFKEIGISLLNGLLWGGIVGSFVFALYQDWALGAVMAAAVQLNLLVAALCGIFIPLTLDKFKRDPASGTSVMLTAITDSMGFFIFLGLAKVFLL